MENIIAAGVAEQEKAQQDLDDLKFRFRQLESATHQRLLNINDLIRTKRALGKDQQAKALKLNRRLADQLLSAIRQAIRKEDWRKELADELVDRYNETSGVPG